MEHKGTFNYNRIMSCASLAVIRYVLNYTAKHGLPENNFFYITLDTTHPQLQIPEWLKKKYPTEITLVLQHIFEDLQVYPDYFSVKLTFNQILSQLTIPFQSIKRFVDPGSGVDLFIDFNRTLASELLDEIDHSMNYFLDYKQSEPSQLNKESKLPPKIEEATNPNSSVIDFNAWKNKPKK